MKRTIILLLVLATLASIPTDCGPDLMIQKAIYVLQAENWEMRRDAIYTLGEIETNSEITLHLVRALDDENWWVRAAAVDVLEEMSPEATVAAPALIRVIGETFKVAEDLEPEARYTWPNPYAQTVESASYILNRMGSDAFPAFVQALEDKEAYIRMVSAAMIWNSGPKAIPTLIQALKDENTSVRAVAARSLGRIRPKATEAVPILIQTLRNEDEDEYVRRSAAQALGEIRSESPETVLALIQTLKDENANVRWAATEALGTIKPEAVEVVPALIQALSDESNIVRASAVTALGRVQQDEELIPLFIQILGDEDGWVRGSAAQELGNIGVATSDVIFALIEALKDEDLWVYHTAFGALEKLEPEEQVISALIQALKGEDTNARRVTINVLKAITNQDFGQDADAWQEWWKAQQQASE